MCVLAAMKNHQKLLVFLQKHTKTLPIYSQNTETTLLGITTKLYFIIRPRNVEKIEKIRKFDFLPYNTLVTMRFRSVVKSSILALFCSKRRGVKINTPLSRYINLVWHANHVRLHLTA